MAVPPRSVASCEASAPPIFPNGVRAAPRITVLGMRTNAIEWMGPGTACADRLPPLMAPITVSARRGAPEDTAADTRVVGVFEGDSLDDPALQRAGRAGRGEARAEEGRGRARGRARRRPAPRADRRPGQRATSFGAEQARVAAAAAAARAKELGAVSLSWASPGGDGVDAGARGGHAAEALLVRPLQVAGERRRGRRRRVARDRRRPGGRRRGRARPRDRRGRQRRARPSEPALQRGHAELPRRARHARSPTSTRRSRSSCSTARRSWRAAWAPSRPWRRGATRSRG